MVKDANSTAQWRKTNKKVTFVDWLLTGFMVWLQPSLNVVAHVSS